MKQILMLLLVTIAISCDNPSKKQETGIVIENEQVKLVVGEDGIVKSLLYKPAHEECLMAGKKVSISSITQDRPYNNEIKLAYPNKEMTFRANNVRLEGDKLIIGYELIPYQAVVRFQITPQYIRFSLDSFIVEDSDYRIVISEPPVKEMWFMQLPVRDRTHFGQWLNVMWDDQLAVNLLGTDPYARIDSEERDGYHILKAGAVAGIRLKGVGAALITCPTDELLDHIALVEEDFGLPHGVKSRRDEKYGWSYYWSGNITPWNVDQHLKYAKMAGLRLFMIYYPAFIKSNGYRYLGNYEWRQPEYPNGMADLRNMLGKIKEAGITPGFHFLHTHIGRESKYVTPVPDHRLNLRKIFTLAKPLGIQDTTIYVEQNPVNTVKAGPRRVLKIGSELISYKAYTTAPPYRFTGCVRGIDATTVHAQPAGTMFGVLDVSEFGARSVYIDQNSSLPDEIADKIAEFYQAGFRFVYWDGSEGVNPPFWYHVSGAQWRVYKKLKPEPLFSEGAAKTHFSWHMLSRGNAFDVFKPEELKEATRMHPAAEAPRMMENFTHVNFGWLGYWVPDEHTVGTQPDMLEYVTSRAAAWDCPVSIHANLKKFEAHPRTPDNLEVLRRWEEVRVQKWLTDEQKQMLRNLDQEHILLINEQQDFELVPYDQIKDVANGSRKVRAFVFERKGTPYVVYWHISGDKKLELKLNPEDVTLLEGMGKEIQLPSGQKDGTVVLPVGKRRFVKTGSLSKAQLTEAFRQAKIVDE